MNHVSVSADAVLMVLDGVFPPVGGGGAEFQVKTLAQAFIRRGVPVRVIAPMLGNGPQLREQLVEGIPVFRISYPRLRYIGGLIMLFRLALMLFRQRRTYIALHAHIAHRMAVVTSIMGWLLGKRVVVKVTGLQELDHGVLSPKSTGLGHRFMRWGFRRATGIQATSTRIKAALEQQGFDPKRVLTIPNAVDLARFAPSGESRARVRATFNIRPETRVFVYAGRLEEEKGVRILVNAWSQAVGAREDAQLWLVGAGSLAESLQCEIHRLQLDGHIRLLGASNHMEEILGAAEVFVLPSFNEGLSNSLLEAMACALPVLGTRVSGTEDFVSDGVTGLLAEPRDEDSLSRALQRMMQLSANEVAAQGQNARALVERSAGIDRVCTMLAERYGISLTRAPLTEECFSFRRSG